MTAHSLAHRFDIVGFDLDGTLLDTSGDLGVALNHALSTIGRPPVPQEQVMGLIGGGSGLMLRRALALTGGDEGIDFEGLRQVLIAHYADHIAHHTATKGNQRGVPIGLQCKQLVNQRFQQRERFTALACRNSQQITA